MTARDFLALAELASETTAPGVRHFLGHQASQDIYQPKKGSGALFPPPTSTTGTAERIRDVMWWRRSVIRPGESYRDFHRRARQPVTEADHRRVAKAQAKRERRGGR